MSRTCMALWPRDGLFLKDGRGWYTSDVGASHAYAWPHPLTIRGALRARYGHQYMSERRTRLRPAQWRDRTEALTLERVITVRRELGEPLATAHRVWPTPADAAYMVDDHGAPFLRRLDPEPPRPGVHGLDDPPLQALWRPYPDNRAKPISRPGFWPEETMLAWLREPPPQMPNVEGFDPVRRTDVHVTITAETQTATQSMLFASDTTETLEHREDRFVEWGLLVDCQVPDGVERFAAEPLLLGGRRRMVPAEPAKAELFEPPDRLGGDSPGLRLILATPAHFTAGWLPDGFAADEQGRYFGTLPGIDGPVILRAAIVPRPFDLSTWDMVARAPRKTWRLVRPGAVYFFTKENDQQFTPAERRALWLQSMGQGTEHGLGLVLPGCWDPTHGG